MNTLNTVENTATTPSNARQLLSLVIPAYNEEEVLPAFHARLNASLAKLDLDVEIIYINDGSTDETGRILRDLVKDDSRVAFIELSRNFGKEMAMTAGLDHANGDVVVVIDSDLQDPPELIAELVRQWRLGYDVVNARRTVRHGESAIKKFTAYAFYQVMQRMSRRVSIPRDVGDFRLLSRRAVAALKQLRERHRFMKGLFSWIGYPQISIPYERDARYAGNTKWGYWKLWNFALEGITSFSTGPLIIATYIGILTALAAFIYALIIIYKTLVFGDPVHGYPSLMVVILFLGGVQLVSVGIIGEYLGRMFDETKKRPLYLIQEYLPAKGKQPRAGTGSSRSIDQSDLPQ